MDKISNLNSDCKCKNIFKVEQIRLATLSYIHPKEFPKILLSVLAQGGFYVTLEKQSTTSNKNPSVCSLVLNGNETISRDEILSLTETCSARSNELSFQTQSSAKTLSKLNADKHCFSLNIFCFHCKVKIDLGIEANYSEQASESDRLSVMQRQNTMEVSRKQSMNSENNLLVINNHFRTQSMCKRYSLICINKP